MFRMNNVLATSVPKGLNMFKMNNVQATSVPNGLKLGLLQFLGTDDSGAGE